MFCGKCGNEIPEGGNFCVKCGTKMENAVQQAPVAEKPKKSKKPIIIAVSAVVGICIIVAIATPSILRANENNDISTSNSYENYDENPATTVGIDDFELPVEELAVTTAAPETTTVPPATTTVAPVTTGDVSIIGNRVGNIANGGLVTHNGEYWIADNYHSIYRYNDEGKSEKFLYTDDDAAIGNLLMDGDYLYFIYDKQVYCYSISADTFSIIPELEKYSDDDMRLYLSNDYYFVYTGHYGEDGILRRISRSTGKEEQNITISGENYFIFWDSCLYYIESGLEKSYLYCVSSSDFSDVKKMWDYDAKLTTIGAGDNYIYVVSMEDDGTYLDKYANELTERVTYFNITDMCQENISKDHGIPWLNVIDNQIFLSVYDTADFNPGLFHIIDNGDTFDYDVVQPVGSGIWGSFVLFEGNNGYRVAFMCSDGVLRYVSYDMNGKLV